MVELRVASDREVCAEVSEAWADVTDAPSELSAELEAPLDWSLERRSSAEAS
jgi:hypothetical protein